MMRTMPTPPNEAADVLVLQHTTEDTPAYLGTWLDRQGLRWHCPCAEAGNAYPASVRGYRALAVLGGEWSANDERASLRHAEALIREAVALDVPVIGHCLGGQLMARALGGQVTRLPEPEIGWLALQHTGSPQATNWLGAEPHAVVYQWHYDSFTALPAGATLLASSGACAHQAFALGPHLAMQFHIEITPEKIEAWLQQPGTVYPQTLQAGVRTVQAPATMRAATAQHQRASEALADRIYTAWRRHWH